MPKPKAFTLIELLTVVTIVGILSGFVFVQTNNALNSGKDTKRKSDVALLASGVASYLSESVSLPVSTNCSINNGCSSDINQIFEVQLGTLPTDPDTGSSYKYQSDGTNCTISAILSTGDTYQYSCSTDEVSSGAPTPGECGTAATTYAPDASSFSGTYCIDGTTATPSFPTEGSEVSWSCPGTYLGESVVCTAYHGQNGSCGTLVNTTSTAYSPTTTDYPSSNFCTTGTTTTPSFPAEGSSSSWVCNAKYSGTNANCIAYRGKNGVCGSSNNGSYYNTSEITTPCESGTATVSGSGSPTGYFTWSCPYTYSGTNTSCTANLKVNGICTTGLTYYTTPSSGTCTTGTATTVTGSGPWYWGCNGTNSGTNTSSTACSALKKVDGSCGGAATSYAYSASAYSGAYCSAGTVNSTPSFPDPGTSRTWTCNGVNGGGNSGTCTASRDYSLVGVCGAAAKIYSYGSSSYGSDVYCSSGQFFNVTAGGPFFPPLTMPYVWACGSSPQVSCRACQYNYVSSYINTIKSNCQAASGNFYEVDGHWLCMGDYVATHNAGFGGTCCGNYTGSYDCYSCIPICK
jgi:prepilin-type N-terminal cleavage/methylation domain-containing protein